MTTVAIVHPKLAAASFEKAIRPLLIGKEQYATMGVHLIGYAFPHLDVDLEWSAQQQTIRLRVDGADYPYRPVSGKWIGPLEELLLPGSLAVPSGNGFHPHKQDGQPGPWFCFMGWKEYHDHMSHQDVSWASIRREPRYAVLQMILQLQRELNRNGVTRA